MKTNLIRNEAYSLKSVKGVNLTCKKTKFCVRPREGQLQIKMIVNEG